MLTADWKEGTKALIAQTMTAYSTLYKEKDWFLHIDLAPAFCAAAWEFMLFKRLDVHFETLKDLVVNEYEDWLDQAVWNAVWRAATNTFENKSL